MSQFLRRLNAIEQVIAGNCPRCNAPIKAASNEDFLAEWAAPCRVCGRQRTFLELVRMSDEETIEGAGDDTATTT